ncbi:MAG: hypothetical protein ACEQSC_02445, partial [Candidatus Nanopelagicaceae bacterium]
RLRLVKTQVTKETSHKHGVMGLGIDCQKSSSPSLATKKSINLIAFFLSTGQKMYRFQQLAFKGFEVQENVTQVV